MTGQKYGRLTVICRADNSKDGQARWRCLCECGEETTVLGKCLRNGHTQSCGCLNKEKISAASLRNLSGRTFGRLRVLDRADDYIAPSGKHHVQWRCVCDCGCETIVDAGQLTSGKTKSCGCLRAEHLAAGNVTHGGRSDRLYHVYSNMKNRCYNSNSQDYQYYGDRGIRICDEWLSDYAAFKKWAYANGYDPEAPRGECTIDRIDVDGNYEPSNCRWVSMQVQSQNRRNVKQND